MQSFRIASKTIPNQRFGVNEVIQIKFMNIILSSGFELNNVNEYRQRYGVASVSAAAAASIRDRR